MALIEPDDLVRGQPAGDRPVHLLVPSVRTAAVAKGGTNYYRAVALACRQVGATTCYELATPGADGERESPWRPDSVEVLVFDRPAALFRALRARQTPGALILKFVGALGITDWVADLHVAQIAQASGASCLYLDPDAPSRLPLIVGRRHYLAPTLHAYAGVVLFAGGDRAVREYQSLAPIPVCHVSAAVTALPLLEAGRSAGEQPEAEHDVLLPVSAYSHREQHILDALKVWTAREPDLQVALVGNWPPMVASRNVTLVPFTDPQLLQSLYRRSRFTINPMRSDFAGYSDTAAARVFEAAVAGSCLITGSFPGLANYLEPGLECIATDDLRALEFGRISEAERSQMAANALRRTVAESTAAAEAFKNFLLAVCPRSDRETRQAAKPAIWQLRRAHDVWRRGTQPHRVAVLPNVSEEFCRRLAGALPAIRLVRVQAPEDVVEGAYSCAAVTNTTKEVLDAVLRTTSSRVDAVFVELSAPDSARSLRWVSGRDWLFPGSERCPWVV